MSDELQLRASAASGCFVCKLLWASVVDELNADFFIVNFEHFDDYFIENITTLYF